MFYTDIHSHVLSGVDDGAASEEMMYQMLDMAYEDGTRTLCLTPHYNPVYYGHNKRKAVHAFDLLSAYAKEKYPDMTLSLGNELGYHTECHEAIKSGDCFLLGGKYLLMDFFSTAPLFNIKYAMEQMLSEGYNVILAHVERYHYLRGQEDLLLDWERRGALFQLDASAFSKDTSFRMKRWVKKLMTHALVHVVASDAHDTVTRPPILSEAELFISQRYGAELARLLLCEIPARIVRGEHI